jgi:GT2 family glycosyltransferase
LRGVEEPQQGLVRARLNGVCNSAAPWLAFVDDDCLLDEMWQNNAVACIAKHPRCGALGGQVTLELESSPPRLVSRHSYAFAMQELGPRERQVGWAGLP